MGISHLTEYEKELVLQHYARFHHPILVAEELKCSIHQVVHHLKKNGIEMNHGRVGACHRDPDKVRQLVQAGSSLSEIARHLKTNKKTVKRFLQIAGIEYTKFQQSGHNNPAWKGGRMIDKDGYVLIWMPEHPYASCHGYVREHRLVMERLLGVILSPHQVVHHKNGKKDDNCPSNLELFESNADHLAATLKGKVPNRTQDGKRRIALERPLRKRPLT